MINELKDTHLQTDRATYPIGRLSKFDLQMTQQQLEKFLPILHIINCFK